MSEPRDWSDPGIAERILRSFTTWAVVGCSSRPWRASHGVSRYLLRQGYRVIPVPSDEGPIEVVDLFRRSEAVLPHVAEAIAIGAKAVWMQLEVWNEDAARLADEAALLVVMNRCPAIDHPVMVGASGA